MLEWYLKELCDLKRYWLGDIKQGNISCLFLPHIFIKPLLQKKDIFSTICFVTIMFWTVSLRGRGSMSSRLCIWEIQFRKQPYMHLFVMKFGWFCWKYQGFHWRTSRDLIFSHDSHTVNILTFYIITIFTNLKKLLLYFFLPHVAYYKPKLMLVTKYQWCSCH